MDINNRIKAAHKAVNNDNIAFSSLDVSSLIELPKEKLAIFLQQLSTAWEEVCNTQKRTIKNNYDLQIKVKELKEREDCLAREYAALQQQFQDYRSKKDAENNRLKNQLRALEEALRIAWDGEAEKLLKQQGLFVSDSEEIDENKTITSPAFNFLSLISDPEEDDDLDGDKARCDFLRGLDKI